ncbi:MAG: DUF1980 domain-containing protein [Desulfovibrionaceae bacterium]|nr:DUF1980 domain-containing protein [Desulfovibrionaceae bacterium]
MHNIQRNLLGRADALLLLGLALFMASLLSGEAYWHYLHPRFRPLTAATALVMAGLGLFSLFRPPRPSGGRTLAFALMLGLALASLPATDPFGSRGEAWGVAEAEKAEEVPDDEAGYLRLNTGELYDLAENNELSRHPGPGFAVRGFVRRDPELDKRGLFGLYRVALFCCFADATAVGFVVRPPDGTLPEDGTWVRVAGRLEPSPGDAPLPDIQVPGIFYASTLPGFVLAADKVVAVSAPREPFMFEWRASPPYAY